MSRHVIYFPSFLSSSFPPPHLLQIQPFVKAHTLFSLLFLVSTCSLCSYSDKNYQRIYTPLDGSHYKRKTETQYSWNTILLPQKSFAMGLKASPEFPLPITCTNNSDWPTRGSPEAVHLAWRLRFNKSNMAALLDMPRDPLCL